MEGKKVYANQTSYELANKRRLAAYKDKIKKAGETGQRNLLDILDYQELQDYMDLTSR